MATAEQNITNKNRSFIAIDGGGSKTEICIYHVDTEAYHIEFFGSANFKVAGIEAVRQNIIDGLLSMCRRLDLDITEVAGLVMGVSGYDSQADLEIFQSVVSEIGIDKEKIYICNDSELIFYSVSQAPGICVIAGTGSIATGYGKNGEIQRSGGWGSPLSDEGSGCWVGSRILREYIRWFDGLADRQPFFSTVEARWKTEVAPLPATLTSLNFSEIASIAKDVMEAAAQGDVFCLAVVDQAAAHVAAITNVVYKRLTFFNQEIITVVMGGSLFRNRHFADKFRATVSDLTGGQNIRFIELDGNLAKNGIRLARKLFDR